MHLATCQDGRRIARLDSVHMCKRGGEQLYDHRQDSSTHAHGCEHHVSQRRHYALWMPAATASPVGNSPKHFSYYVHRHRPPLGARVYALQVYLRTRARARSPKGQ